METIYSSAHSFQIGLPIAGLIAAAMFVIGFWLGHLKAKKLVKKLAKMEKKIMDLNSELLYNR